MAEVMPETNNEQWLLVCSEECEVNKYMKERHGGGGGGGRVMKLV